MKPKALKPGDTIGVFAPSSRVDPADLERSAALFERRGYRVYIHPQCRRRLNQSAGTPTQKINALNDLLQQTDIKAIFAARGGNRALTILDRIDYALIKKNPKILIGYSDFTSILNSVYNKTGLTSLHGSVFREIHKRSPQDRERLFALLEGGRPDLDLSRATVLRRGTARGRLIGGNLSILQALCGTPFQPRTRGALLFIEDTGDHLSRYDRMLAHLRLAGWFDGLAGLIAGSFTDTQDDPARPFGFTLADILREHTKGYDFPVVMDAPFGHGDRLAALPVGATAILHAGGRKPRLELPAAFFSK